MKNKMKWILAVGLLSCSVAMAQQQSDILSVSASANAENAALAFDRNVKTMWTIPSQPNFLFFQTLLISHFLSVYFVLIPLLMEESVSL